LAWADIIGLATGESHPVSGGCARGVDGADLMSGCLGPQLNNIFRRYARIELGIMAIGVKLCAPDCSGRKVWSGAVSFFTMGKNLTQQASLKPSVICARPQIQRAELSRTEQYMSQKLVMRSNCVDCSCSCVFLMFQLTGLVWPANIGRVYDVRGSSLQSSAGIGGFIGDLQNPTWSDASNLC